MKFRPTPKLLTGIFMGIVSLTTFNATAENAVKPYWQDVQVVAVNKEYPRTVFMTYDNRDDALSGKFERSKILPLIEWNMEVLFCRFL